jgi:hypothetical protein
MWKPSDHRGVLDRQREEITFTLFGSHDGRRQKK